VMDFIGTNSKAKQRTALFAALLACPISTVDARDILGISHPAGRVKELRREGHDIKTLTTYATDAAGHRHRTALYVLQLPLDLEGGEE